MQISVIIPTYNAAATITRAVDSVLAQSQPVDEILIIDDGSTDNTAEIVRNYGEKIRYFYQQNTGVAGAMNYGIEQAKGEWIAVLAADDEWLPHWVSTQENILKNYSHVMWSCCNSDYARNGIFFKRQSYEIANFLGAVRYFDVVLRGLSVGACGFLIHRSVFDKVGMFKPEMRSGQDTDLWSRIAMRYPNIGYSSDICWRYYQDNVNSISKTERPRDLQVKSICENIILARSLGQDVIKAYYPYARKLAMSYILRAAAKKVQVRCEMLDEAKMFFPLTFCERAQEAMLKVLPALIAGKVVGRLGLAD